MDETQPEIKISVLIVSYNCATALRRCLDALERSVDRETIEILVVDNGSRDESGRLDEDFPEVTILRLPRNFGLTKARNIGIRTAKGEFLLLLDPDSELQPETISTLAARLDQETAAVAVCPLLADPRGDPVSQTGPLPTPDDLYLAWCEGEPWQHPLPATHTQPPGSLASDSIQVECPDPRAILVRRQFVKGMNYFDERYGHFGANLELFHQARRASKKILLLPGVRATTHCGAGLWVPTGDDARALLAADYGAGLIAYAGKHFGWKARMKLWFKMLFRAKMRVLWALLRMRDVGYHFSIFTKLLAGQKIDGSQQGQ